MRNPVSMVDTTTMSIALIGVVGLAALTLFAVTLLAQRRSGNPRLTFVSLAFLAFSVKSGFVAAVLMNGWLVHEHLEVVQSLFDLAIIGLLFVPLFVRR